MTEITMTIPNWVLYLGIAWIASSLISTVMDIYKYILTKRIKNKSK